MAKTRRTRASTSRRTTTTKRKAPKAAARPVSPLERLTSGPMVAEMPSAVSISLGTTPRARTVVYIHGIGNKPPASVLKCQWDHALFPSLPLHGDLGDRTRMSYWVNREIYPTPSPGTCSSGDRVTEDLEEPASMGALAAGGDPIEAEIAGLARNENERAVLRALAARAADMADTDNRAAKAFTAAQMQAKVLPLPPFIRRQVTRQITRRFLRDVHDFFFVPERRAIMRNSLRERLLAGGGPFVVIGHSQGSMVAYDVLRELKKHECDVALFVTIGSPLGLAEVQDVLTQFAGTKRLPFPSCVETWVNVADRLDPVAADSDLSRDFPAWKAIVNYRGFGLNPDSPRHPHSGTGYLSTPQVRAHVMGSVGTRFAQPLGDFVIARDLVGDLEDARPEQTHEVLIELKSPEDTGGAVARDRASASLDDRRATVIESVRQVAGRDVEFEELRRFVAARLTRAQVERLRTRHKELSINAVWRDAAKRALIHRSTHMVQARPANRGYGATGEGIHWAILDTGIWSGHPHFERYRNVAAQWDCTRRGAVIPWEPTPGQQRLDGHGHGTHVAGIVAGSLLLPGDEGAETEPLELDGMAPRARLHIYKVLRDDGTGSDSFIIKALDHIAEVNEREPQLVIHGVNLSLGGPFDPAVYGCGHSPLCRELRRLWRQGVLVVIAAGNEGRASVAGEHGILDLNLALSISDPANLDEGIAVGSVHKTNPHTYGVSYFSSRGPTADGRPKPDVVAPGEQILSASHRAPAGSQTIEELYVAMDGTSMAAPHVSGVLAAFLSRRREFIGYPDRVKTILLENCTSLGRETYFQGHGMPNLIKMLANS
jgi:subtilisin family serine protease